MLLHRLHDYEIGLGNLSRCIPRSELDWPSNGYEAKISPMRHGVGVGGEIVWSVVSGNFAIS